MPEDVILENDIPLQRLGRSAEMDIIARENIPA